VSWWVLSRYETTRSASPWGLAGSSISLATTKKPKSKVSALMVFVEKSGDPLPVKTVRSSQKLLQDRTEVAQRETLAVD